MRNKNIETYLNFFKNYSPICPHNFSFHALSLYFLFDVSCISLHLRTNSINFSSISEDKDAALVARKYSKFNGGDLRLSTLSVSGRYRPVRTRSVMSNILARQRPRNGTETWRRRSCQCEQLGLIMHEKSLLNGDVPRRNGNVTYSANRP